MTLPVKLSLYVVSTLTAVLFETATLYARDATFVFERVALTGDSLAGQPPQLMLRRLGVPVIDELGQVAFDASLQGPAVTAANEDAIVEYRRGAPELIARSGDPVPGFPGHTWASGASLVLNGDAVLSFSLPIFEESGQPRQALWLSMNAGMPAAVAVEGQQAAGFQNGILYDSFGSVPAVNSRGTLTFSGTVAGPGIITSNNAALWAGDIDALQLVARATGKVPDRPAGVLYQGFPGVPLINVHSDLLFPASYGGPGPTGGQALITGPAGSLRIAAATDMTAPGTGSLYEQFRQYQLNALGQVAFHARLRDLRNGIWAGDRSNVALVALTGQDAPGTGGATFGGSHPFVFDDVRYNDQGQTAFTASVIGAGVMPENNSGLWLGRSGQLQLVAREGDLAPGLADGVRFSDFQSFADVSLNNSGQLAFLASLTGPGVTSANDLTLWAWSDNQLCLVLREGALLDVGDAALRTVTDIDFTPGFSLSEGFQSAFNDRGQLALHLDVLGNTEAIFVVTIPEPSAVALLLTGVAAVVGMMPTQLTVSVGPTRCRENEVTCATA